MFSYTVKCTFKNAEVARDWLAWLELEHVNDVLRCGATSAEIFQMDGELAWEIRYRFASREEFRKYESEHAPRLRKLGLDRFPLSEGLVYSRSSGQSVAQWMIDD